MSEIFYKDKGKIFECKVFVEGASVENTKARLVLKFPDQNVNHLYYGKIDENNVFTVDIPALKEIKGTTGTAILEVIADSTFFESWSGDIELKQSKTVKVEMISHEKQVIKEAAPKVVVELKKELKEEVKEVEKPIVVEKKIAPKKAPLSTKDKLLSMFKEHRSSITKEQLKDYFPSFTATQISEAYKLQSKDNLSFQYFLDKNIRPSKLMKIKKLVK